MTDSTQMVVLDQNSILKTIPVREPPTQSDCFFFQGIEQSFTGSDHPDAMRGSDFIQTTGPGCPPRQPLQNVQAGTFHFQQIALEAFQPGDDVPFFYPVAIFHFGQTGDSVTFIKCQNFGQPCENTFFLGKQNPLRVEIRAEPAQPLGEDEAKAAVSQLAARLGVPREPASAQRTEIANGIVHLEVLRGKKVLARVGMGLHSRELRYIERPLAAEHRARLPRALEKLVLFGGAGTTKDGVSIRLTHQGHAHKVGGGVDAVLEVRLSKGGKSRTLQLVEERVYAEARAFGRVFALKMDDKGRIVALVYPDQGSIDQDMALRLVERFADELGLAPNRHSVSNGRTGAYDFDFCRDLRLLGSGVVGAYTGRVVWFSLVDGPIADR